MFAELSDPVNCTVCKAVAERKPAADSEGESGEGEPPSQQHC